MHVIAGSARGRRLLAPKGASLRPTTGRVKEALFSILLAELPGARFLDLFAGTGAVGIEALSRGASHVTFVESDAASCRLLRQNVTRCGFEGAAGIHQTLVESYLKAPAPSAPPADLVFADPPYGAVLPLAVLSSLEASGILAPHTTVIIEHASNVSAPAQVGRLMRRREYRYGDTSLTRYTVSQEGPLAP
jgi:16S rRNA (guanine(966)-N(2))-methyltransferase RsmD